MNQSNNHLALKGAELAVKIWPQKDSSEWILLNNGHTRPSSDFNMMARYLNQSGYNCISFDPRGSGDTTISSKFSFKDMVADCWAVLEHFNIKSGMVLGVSMGGMISQSLLIERPSFFKKAILVSTSPSFNSQPENKIPWGDTRDSVYNKLKNYFSNAYVEKNKLIVNAMVKQILEKIKNGNYNASSAQQHLALEGFDVSSELARIQSDVLVVHGDQDQIIPISSALKIKNAIPSGEIAIHEGKGHLLIAESGKALYQQVVDHLAIQQ